MKCMLYKILFYFRNVNQCWLIRPDQPGQNILITIQFSKIGDGDNLSVYNGSYNHLISTIFFCHYSCFIFSLVSTVDLRLRNNNEYIRIPLYIYIPENKILIQSLSIFSRSSSLQFHWFHWSWI